jgi:hypothetical protein
MSLGQYFSINPIPKFFQVKIEFYEFLVQVNT